MSLVEPKVGVVGLGYVGLPLVEPCARCGYRVVGPESNPRIADTLRDGSCHIRDHTVEQLFGEARDGGNLQVSSDPADIADCSIYLVCVPTPLEDNRDPDLAPLESACRTFAPCLAAGDLIVVESTVFPGACEEIVLPLLRDLLVAKAAELAVFDSGVTSGSTIASLSDCIAGARVIVIVNEHSEMVAGRASLDLTARGVEVIVDGRNCLEGEHWSAQGIDYRGIVGKA